MATLTELQQELTDVKAAISAARTAGQSFGRGSKNLTRVDYQALLDEKRELERRIQIVSNGGGIAGAGVVFDE